MMAMVQLAGKEKLGESATLGEALIAAAGEELAGEWRRRQSCLVLLTI